MPEKPASAASGVNHETILEPSVVPSRDEGPTEQALRFLIPSPAVEYRHCHEVAPDLAEGFGELDRYLAKNVQTDSVHWLMLHSALAAASESLKQDNFWPGYAEGITRLALVLMGDYPDHRKRGRGGRRGDHYQLSRFREVRFLQSPAQQSRTLLAAPQIGIRMKTPPGSALVQFHSQSGSKSDPAAFLAWYRKHHPEDYAAVF